jgi:hypothetical protein
VYESRRRSPAGSRKRASHSTFLGDVPGRPLIFGAMAVIVLIAVRIIRRVHRQRRRHRRRANKHFMAGYRAAFNQARRITVETSALPTPPVTQPPGPVDTLRPLGRGAPAGPRDSGARPDRPVQ